jgi:hypothetical protein
MLITGNAPREADRCDCGWWWRLAMLMFLAKRHPETTAGMARLLRQGPDSKQDRTGADGSVDQNRWLVPLGRHCRLFQDALDAFHVDSKIVIYRLNLDEQE